MSKFPPMPDDVIEVLLERPVDIGHPFASKHDFHHCILGKGNVRGMPDSEKAKIHRPWNIIVIEHGLHMDKPVPEGYDAVLWMYEHHPEYPREVIERWFYEEIQWRDKPPFRLP